MRIKALAFAASFLLISNSSVSGLQTPTTTTTAIPQRDPQAVSVVSQMIAATNWGPGALPQDAVASGIVTRFQDEKQDAATVTWRFKGSDVARVDVQDADGPTTIIVNNGRAAILRSSKTRFLPFHAALAMQPLTIPFFSDLFDFSGTNLSFLSAGIENVAGQPANRIEVDSIPDIKDPLSDIRRTVRHLTLWVSLSTSLPVQIQYARISDDNPTAIRLRTRMFSDYRIVGGFAVPFHQEESASGRALYTIQLTAVNLNNGLSDNDFALPTVDQAVQP
jgi:hypothetical protein